MRKESSFLRALNYSYTDEKGALDDLMLVDALFGGLCIA